MKEPSLSAESIPSNSEQSKDASFIISYFDKIKVAPDIHPEAGDFSAVFDDIEYRQHCFEEIKKSFLLIYDKNKVNAAISSKPNEDSFIYLKQVRRIGLILRESYLLFSSEHSSPQPFYLFIKSLGGFNDQYWFSAPKELGEKVAERNIGNFEFNDPSIENKDFRKYVEKILSDTKELLKEQILSMEEFHGLRKNIRLCADIMQVSAAEDYQGKLHWLFSSLLDLSVRLGKEHDEYIQRDLKGEINYKKTKVEVDPYVVENFNKLRPFIKKVMGIM